MVPGSNQIVVDHKEIKGFMDAMTMGYRIEPPSLLEGMKAGDSIRFTIDTQQKAIVKIEKMHSEDHAQENIYAISEPVAVGREDAVGT